MDAVGALRLSPLRRGLYIDHAAFLGTINPDTNKIPKHLFQGYLNIYNNYFKAPWMPDRTEANPNELNQDDARYGFRCCHLKNIWTAPLPPETELSRQMTTSTTSIDIMVLKAAYANLHTDQERDYFMQRYHDVISSFGGKTSYVFFFFNDPATTEIYTNLNTLSLHDALPISHHRAPPPSRWPPPQCVECA